jgi:osmotically-inducible protein OsmY
MLRTTVIVISLALTALLSGCTAAVATTAVVATDMATDRRTTGAYIEDEAIEQKADQALGDDQQIDELTDISVVSFNRVVLIYGQAPNQALKNKAAAIVRNIANIKKIHNEIRIAAPSSFMTGSSDAIITSEAKLKMLTENDFSSGHIKVVTENGELFLMGMVTKAEGEKAISIVREIDGVQRVINVFEYIPESAVTD